jgi:hypothetical protein
MLKSTFRLLLLVPVLAMSDQETYFPQGTSATILAATYSVRTGIPKIESS